MKPGTRVKLKENADCDFAPIGRVVSRIRRYAPWENAETARPMCCVIWPSGYHPRETWYDTGALEIVDKIRS